MYNYIALSRGDETNGEGRREGREGLSTIIWREEEGSSSHFNKSKGGEGGNRSVYKLHKVSFDLYSISTFRYRLKEYRYDLFFNLAPGFLKRKRVRRDKVSRIREVKKNNFSPLRRRFVRSGFLLYTVGNEVSRANNRWSGEKRRRLSVCIIH